MALKVPSPAEISWGQIALLLAAGGVLAAALVLAVRWLVPEEGTRRDPAFDLVEAAHAAFVEGRFADAGTALARAHGQAATPTLRSMAAEMLGDLSVESGDHGRAVAWYREAERIAREEEGLLAIEASMHLLRIAQAQAEAGDFEAALATEREIAARYAEESTADAASVRRGSAAPLLAAVGRGGDGIAALDEALAALARLAGEGSDGAVELLAQRAALKARAGDAAGARADIDRAFAIARASRSAPALARLPMLHAAHGAVLLAEGRDAEALAAWREAVEGLEADWRAAESARVQGLGWLGGALSQRAQARWRTAELERAARAVDAAWIGEVLDEIAAIPPPRAPDAAPPPPPATANRR